MMMCFKRMISWQPTKFPKKSARTAAELPNRLKPRRYRGQMLGGLGLWAGFVACKRVAGIKSWPP